MKSVFIKTDIQDIDQVLNDFTKCQGYDGQIISSQTKYRNTNQYTTDTAATAAPIRIARINLGTCGISLAM